MIKKIQSYLIHLLGGITVEESQESDFNSFTIGAYCSLSRLRSHADAMYGKSSEEWCESMYREIVRSIENLKP